MTKTKRNRNFKNSHGISNQEYLLGSAASTQANRELYQDFDYLDKLSPDEFAWLAEFMSNEVQGVLVNPDIVGDDNAAILNDRTSIRAKFRAKNRRQNNSFEIQGKRQSIYHSSASQDAPAFDETLLSVDSFLSMQAQIESNINAYWDEKDQLRYKTIMDSIKTKRKAQP